MNIALSRVEPSEPSKGESDEQGWYVAYTQPQREQLAQINLTLQGFEAYLCQYKTFKKSPDGLMAVLQPMFPRYIFFRPTHAGQSISVVRSTRGISFVLRFGLIPALLKPEELRMIKALESAQNQVDVGETSPFQPGLRVRLQNCGLNGLEGLVHSVSSKRVTLLIQLLGREKKLQLEHHQVELLDQ
ncbi:transcription termination/antitermination NusG family protein [Polaromonas sp.]|uniref:transcription termination/antitermination protein NusG n=1 Tax=Polaromonas sp. TaxID=1869339 RepID=UPI0013BA1A9E|nr:transcription termination/antitermination NusG family protein [Polaromonas sp.]NDP61466.1 transcriptional activator RfaH [Polaromonas sp.]